MSRRSFHHALALVVGIVISLGESALLIRASLASPVCPMEQSAPNILSSDSIVLLSEAEMRDPPDTDHTPDRSSEEQPTDPQEQLRQIEEQLRNTNLIFRHDVQNLLKVAYYTRNPANLQFALRRLRVALDAYKVQEIRVPDAFRPYGPQSLLSQGNVLLLIQQDGVTWLVPVDSLLTGVVLVGPQQSGKTRLIVNLCREILAVDPTIVITVIDPKDTFKAFKSTLNSRYWDMGSMSFALRPPAGTSEEDFVLEFIPPLADTGGLVYGVEVLTEAALIALDQLDSFRKHTGRASELCLRDIYVSLPLVKGTSSGRRQGYREAAQTALRRILGEKGLFACRRGISMEDLFHRNTILGGRSLTDDMQCRALALFLLYWQFQRYRLEPETNRLRHLIICDDATRFFGTAGDQFGAASRTSPLAHVLAMLRSTGVGLIVATQLPALLDPSLLALSRTMVAVGPTSGSQHLKVVSDFMHLEDEQAKAVTRLSTREAVGFAPGTAFKEPLHGWVPWVDDPPASGSPETAPTAADLGIEPWHHLADVPSSSGHQPGSSESVHTAPASVSPVAPAGQTGMAQEMPDAQTVVYDCVSRPFDSVSARVKRLGLSGRGFEQAKRAAVAAGWIIPSQAGQTLYLIATEKAFAAFGLPCPYADRRVSLEHSFYTSLTAFLLKKDVRYQRVQAEVALGQQGSTTDVLATTRDGLLEAWEVSLTTNHVLANITKYRHTAHRIVLLARTYELSVAIKGLVKGSGLDPELIARVEYVHVSQLLRRARKLSQY